ncbi:GMC family oxidoreductase [Oculatella sp. LEGE 06141]|uniref:GMC oxidoreductase n=1 Tax=Oculatella sp. LEGE 06141 TaxID=1828648 RepID=UPI0018821283|nr:GMC family oxidoreductase [Oculatella sp. LEGE 06141]MBE9178336.1 GMC family oxidoreductase [Oculatella sp. LEGE 06141]
MIIDARTISSGETIECDVCIVGAGPAGITIAHELCNQGLNILLLESGGIKYEKNLEQLNHGEVNLSVHTPLEQYRRRQIGGATTFWGGRCVPFDESDFEVRPHVPHSGWPITKTELNPYYQRAHTYCEIGQYEYAAEKALSESGRRKMISGFESADVSIEHLYLFSPPTDFGRKYLDSLKRSQNVNVFIYATCLKIITNSAGTRVDYLQVASMQKNEFLVSARQFILAAGGLEVTRLLLVSNDVYANGIGNQHDLLGRFYMGHINHLFDVKFKSPEKVMWDYEKTPDGVYCQRQIAIAENKRQQYGLLNQRVFMERPKISDPSHRSSILSATYLLKGVLNQQKKYRYPSQHVRNILFDFDTILKFSHKWMTKRILSDRKLPSVVAKSASGIYTFRVDSEQVPNPESRVSLSRNKDAFGINQLKVDWRCTELDVNSISKSVFLIGEAFAKAGVGELQSLPTIFPSAQGGHHLGTTRMSETPQTGVVDVNGRVHGLSNLYIASSSVFATASYANPTLTVVALAIRLADYLKKL